jgi:hypothetical protein
VLPGVARQAGFVAGLDEEGFGDPSSIRSRPAAAAGRAATRLHHQPVAADFDVLGSGDRLERTEQRDLDLELLELGRRDRRKRGSVVPAATAQRGTTVPSGSLASMWPMQPRSSRGCGG